MAVHLLDQIRYLGHRDAFLENKIDGLADFTIIDRGKNQLPRHLYHAEPSGINLYISYASETSMPLNMSR